MLYNHQTCHPIDYLVLASNTLTLLLSKPPKMSQAVRRFAQIVKLKPQHLAEYKDVHARVWPDVLAQIKQCNIKDCTAGYMNGDKRGRES